MSNKKIKNKEEEHNKDREKESSCCYVVDPCGCYNYMFDPCGCAVVNPCCC